MQSINHRQCDYVRLQIWSTSWPINSQTECIIINTIRKSERILAWITCITLMGKPVSLASCSLMCLVGLGVCENAVFRISNCFALIVVRGPRLLDPPPPSPLPPPAPPSGLLFSVWLSLVSGSPSREPEKIIQLLF